MYTPSRSLFAVLALVSLVVAACQIEPVNEDDGLDTLGVTVNANYEAVSSSELERARYERRFRRVARIDTAAADSAAASNPEQLSDIDNAEIDTVRIHLPLGGNVEGPSVLRAQILLDRAGFAPGIIDGRWGDNVEKSVYWFQEAFGIAPTGVIDSLTYRRLRREAARPDTFIVTYRVTAEDIAGPFERIPSDIYEKAEMDAMGYESFAEKLGEMFHASPDVLRRLNPGVNLNRLTADDPVRVPNVRGARADRGPIDRLVVSGEGEYLHALAPDGRILYHFPTTVGASYDPSPRGNYRITSITKDPWWHYQPAILENVPDDEPSARIPPGPNNAVGVVWMALSEPHYGIHGTSAPETIGYVSSSGCIRLTNWDALFLADRIEAGTDVDFRDIPGRDAAPADSTRARTDSSRADSTR